MAGAGHQRGAGRRPGGWEGPLEIRRGGKTSLANCNRRGTWEIASVARQVAPGFMRVEEEVLCPSWEDAEVRLRAPPPQSQTAPRTRAAKRWAASSAVSAQL